MTTEIIDPVVDFSAVGDGSTDNATAFEAMRDHMLLTPATEFIINFQSGDTYHYTNNRWLWSVGHVTINATGVTFKNTSASAFSADQRPFNTHSIWDTGGDIPESTTQTYTQGDTIASTAVGATQVVLQAGGTFAVGDHVLLHGFNQQTGGFPPNLRFFEYNEITVVSGSTLTLLNPTIYAYEKDDWPDENLPIFSADVGKARILNLDRGTAFTQPRHIEFNGGTWVANGGGFDSFLLSADTLIVKNVTGPSFLTPSENRSYLAEKCTFVTFELDKQVDTCIGRNCTFSGNVQEGPAVHNLLIEDCTIGPGIIRVASDVVMIRKNTITGTASLVFGIVQDKQAWSCELMTVRENTFVFDASLSHLINNHQAAVNDFTVEGTTGTDIHMTTTHIQRIKIGSRLWDQDTPADGGNVTGLVHDGTKWLISGDWGVTPSGLWEFMALQHVTACGNIQSGPAEVDVYRFPAEVNSNVDPDCIIERISGYPKTSETGETADTANLAIDGKINSTGRVLLTANGVATTTVLLNYFIGPESVVILDPMNTAAATEKASGSMYILKANRGTGTLTITHTASTNAREFAFAILG
jgi:hypothetical protein